MLPLRILLLTQVLPFPADSGPKVKTWNTIKFLARDHQVTLVSFSRGEPAAAVEGLRAYCAAVHTVPIARSRGSDLGYLLASVAEREPFLIRRDRRAALHDLVARLVAAERFDAVHADQMNMAQYAVDLPVPLKVLDAHNALWAAYRQLAAISGVPARWLWRREARLLQEYEGAMGRRFDQVLAVSEEDRSDLAAVLGSSHGITVIPIAVDSDEVAPVARRPDADRIVHIGTMVWPPNADGLLWFLREALPLIRAVRPSVAVDLIGARPPTAIRAAAARAGGVTLHGYVADPTPLLERAAVVVVPVRAASGVRVRILNGLAQALPVVTTPAGCQGLDVQSGRDLLVAADAAEFAAAVCRLLADRALAATLASAGRRALVERYDYRAAYRPLAELYAGKAAP
jgi:glycosyltransferase involved in cell wall biosynthesis